MKKKICSLVIALAVAVTAVNFPAVAGAESNTSGVAVKVTQRESTAEDSVRRMNISAQNHGTEDAVLKIYLLNEDGETADTEVETPDLCEDTPNEMEETLKNALTLADGTSSSLEAEWINETDNSGAVTERYLEAAVPAGAAASFDMQLVYRADEADYTKKTIVKAKAFVNGQEVTKASDGENADNEAEASWETAQSAEESGNGGDSEAIESAAAASKSAAVKSTASTQSAENYAESRAKQADANSSITSMYNVPVTYYDYLDDIELTSTWRNVMEYGYDRDNGWTPFWHWNQGLATYYRDNNLTVPTGLYFGNLYTNSLGSDPSGNGAARQAQVFGQINMVKGIYSGYSYPANNSNNLSGGMNSSAYGLVYNQLDNNGDLQISEGVAAPWFGEKFLAGKASVSEVVNSYGQVLQSRFPFRTVDEDGVSYYEFDSNNGTDNVRYENNGTFSYYSGGSNAVDDGADDYWGSTDSDNGGYGFFPFNKPGDSSKRDIDYGFGAKFQIRFNLPKGGALTDSNGNKVPVTFEFTGDDDVWVFIDGQLVLDMGGAHKKATGEINFKDLTARVTTGGQTINSGTSYNSVDLKDVLGVESSAELSPNQGHTMTIFYMERGMIESNLKIRFNMQPLEHELIVEKDVDVENVNEGLQDTVENADEFNVALSADNSAAADKTYQKNDGTTGDTEYGLKTDSNGSFTLKDGDQAVFKKQFDDDIGQTITAVETEQEEKSNLQYDTDWTAVDLENNNAEIASDTDTKTATFTYDKTAGDDFTPVRNKLTYVNTPQIGSLSVEKKTVDDNGDSYEDPSTDFRFQIVLDMGIKTEGQEVSEVVSDPDSIYVRKPDNWSTIYAYCWNSTTDEKNQSYPGVQLTAANRVEGFANTYKLENVRDKYDRVIFSVGNDSNKTGDLTITSSSSDPNMKSNYYSEAGGWDNTSQFLEYDTHYEPGEEIGFRGYRLAYKINGIGDTLYTDEGGYFTLKSGEKAVFEGIPAGTEFKIQEVSADGYTIKDVTINGSQPVKDTEGEYTGYYNGDIVSQTETKVAVTNEKAEVALSLKAHKTVDDGEKTPSAGEFRFVMSGMGSKTLDDGTKTEDTTDYRSEVSNDVDGAAEFPTISYQKEGTYLYTIKEVTKTDAKYQYDKSEYEVKVVVEADGSEMTRTVTVTKVKDRDGQPLNPPVDVQDIDTGIVFDNITNTAALTVQKQLVKENGDPLERTSWPNQSTNFAFTFRLERWNENTSQYEPCGNQTYYFNNQQRTTQADGTFYLQPQDSASGAKAEFRDLIIGTKYRITEVLTNMSEYEFKNATINGTDAEVKQNSREYAIETSIQKNENAVVFKNYPLSSITIIKEDGENKPLAGAEFKLERKISDNTWEQVGEIKTSQASDGKVYFSNLHAGDYRITEVKTKAGYVLLKEPIEITLPYEYKAGSIVNGSEVNADGTAYNITFTVINGQAFDLPQSGRKGIRPLAAAGMAVVVMAGTAFAARNIRGQKAVSRRRKRRPR